MRLAKQAQDIRDRVEISEKIYLAEMNFEPLVGFTYHLYERAGERFVLSMVGPKEWGTKPPYPFIATVRLLADHTWEIIDQKA